MKTISRQFPSIPIEDVNEKCSNMEISVKRKVDEINLKPIELLLPLYEAIVNSMLSLESINKRKGYILIKILRDSIPQQSSLLPDLLDNVVNTVAPISSFIIEDNGPGFDSSNFKSFGTAYSERYASKGGKGIGRFTILACFNQVHVTSFFKENSGYFKREFDFDINNEISPSDGGLMKLTEAHALTTTVKLSQYKPKFKAKAAISCETVADQIVEHCLLYFLSGNMPTISVYDELDDQTIVLNDIFKELIHTDHREVTVTPTGSKHNFSMFFLRNTAAKIHKLKLCANNRHVGKTKNLEELSSGFSSPFSDDNNNRYFLEIYVTSKYFDDNVNPLRNSFNMPEDDSEKTLFDEFTLKDIYGFIKSSLEAQYSAKVADAQEQNLQRIKRYVTNPGRPRFEYRTLLSMPSLIRDIPANISEDRLDEFLYKVKFDYRKDLNKKLDSVLKKKQIEDHDEYKNVISDLIDKESSFAKDQLADCVIRRKSVIKAFRKLLELKDNKYQLEEDIHNIIFSMGGTNDTMPYSNHNLWILDERLAFHSYIASDKPMASMEAIEGGTRREPDLTIFDFPWAFSDDPSKINSLVIFEFKRPGRDMMTSNDKDLDSQIIKYFQDLSVSKAKDERGNFLNIQNSTPKFGYVICDLHNDLVEYNTKWNGFKQTPFGSLYKIVSDVNLHIEVMNYKQMLEFSEHKHYAFFKELGIDGY